MLIKAQIMFQQLLSYANHLALYAEEIAQGGEQLGNFPQAFTHIGIISTAFNLDRALREAH
jgi:GH15 family glucan-1,4-alpha-glucosidase